ncbi:MAG TPA: amidohydrolase family protein [Caulobacteraceae bacterium]|jgi:Tol biopolymer transport system component
MARIAGWCLAAILFAAPALAHASGLPMTPARHIAFDTNEGTWLSLAASPRDGTIIFDMLGHLYAVDAAGGPARALTRGLAFDSQPVFSPNGTQLAFISDRSGAENLWVAKTDGSDARQITHNDTPNEFVSPVFSPDGRYLYASLYRSDHNAAELWRFPIDGGPPEALIGGASAMESFSSSGPTLVGGATSLEPFSALGAAPTPDGRYVYYAIHEGPLFEDDVTLPLWAIERMDLATHARETIVTNEGSAMRPVISPDGKLLVYAVRIGAETGLRVRTLDAGGDRALIAPIQRDDQEALPTRDLVPTYAFTPNGRAILAAIGGHIERVDLATGAARVIPFEAHISLNLGPFLRQDIKTPTGPVKATIIQWPVQSPDGRRLAFSALGRLYVMDLAPNTAPHELATDLERAFQPAWSPDGQTLAFVTWSREGGGQIWTIPGAGGRAHSLTTIPAYYTDPAFAPDGRSVLALRSSAHERNEMGQEPLFTGRAFGPLRQADLVEIPLNGGPARVVASGLMSGPAQFGADTASIMQVSDKGLEAIDRTSGVRRLILTATGPGYYFLPKDAPADDYKLSPDGRWALIQIDQRLYLVAVNDRPGETIDLNAPATLHATISSVGADFFAWADGGRTVTWAIGSSFYRQPLAAIALDPGGSPVTTGARPKAEVAGVEAFEVDVSIPRDVPQGEQVLRGATVITERGQEVIANADILIRDDRIAAIGPYGTFPIPPGAKVRDLTGRFVTPGFVDVHDHIWDIRRGVLQFDDWDLKATLAYGVTTAFDPSTLSIDMLAYQDLIAAGEVTGPRLFSTGVALFSFNRLTSLQQTEDLVSRYVDHYATRNLKEYRTGNRRQRQWVAMAAFDQHAMPTTEGAVDMKLDLTQIIDGMSGNEHSLSAVPLYRDVIQLLAQSRVSYDLTLEISHGGPPAGESFIAATAPMSDPKLRHFYPDWALAKLYSRVHWVDPSQALYPRLAASAGAAQTTGAVIGIGSHGNYPGIGYHWELFAMSAGGLTPRQVLKMATMGGADTIGRMSDVGSLEPGKFADLLVFQANPIADIHNVDTLQRVMKGGRMYDAASLTESP